MKKIFTIASIALVAVLALSCRKATSEMPAKYQPAQKLTFEGPGALEFDAEGGEVCLLVDTHETVEVKSSAEWVGVEISGRYIYISAPLNDSIYPRYSTVELTCGDRKASLQAKQLGVASNYFWDPEYEFPYTAATLTLKFHKTDATVSVDVEGQDWISVDLESQTMVINIAKNPTNEAREGSVTWKAGKDVRTIVIKQALNPNGDNPDDPDDPDEPTGDVLFSEDFEDEDTLDDWLIADVDQDGYCWEYADFLATHSGMGVLFSQSYINDIGPLEPDNWAVTPGIKLGSDNYLSFWVAAQDPSYNAEHFAAYVTTDLENFQSLFEGTFPVSSPYEQETITINVSGENKDILWQRIVVKIPDSFDGGTAYIAFRHFDCTDMYYLNLDDVMVTKGQPEKTVSSVASVSSVNVVKSVLAADFMRR